MSASFSAREPWDMLMRTPFTPALSNASITPGPRVDGPSVARIFAFLNNAISSLVDAGNQRRHTAFVIIELVSKFIAQETLFDADTNYRASEENNNCDCQTDPVADCQTG